MVRTPSLWISLFLLLLGVSLNCDENCAVCLSNSCQSCRNPYYLSSTLCTRCPQDCLACTAPSLCQTCVVGYFPNAGTCHPCSNGCRTCQTPNNCTQCGNIYYLEGGLCKQCPSNCGTCSLGGCLTCAPNFYRVGNHTCKECTKYCAVCSDEVGCTRCIGEFYPDGSNCQPCNSQCGQCSNATTCTACRAGLYLSNATCVSCSTCWDKPYCTAHASCPNATNSTAQNGTDNATETVSPSNNSWQIIIYIGIPIVAAGLVFLACYCRRKPKPEEEPKDQTLGQTGKTTLATDNELKVPTQDGGRLEKTLHGQIHLASDENVFGPQSAPSRTTTP